VYEAEHLRPIHLPSERKVRPKPQGGELIPSSIARSHGHFALSQPINTQNTKKKDIPVFEPEQKELAAQGPKVLPTPLASNEQKGAS